jgi:predicted Zn-dependent protease
VIPATSAHRLRALKIVRIGRAVSRQLVVSLRERVDSAFSNAITETAIVDYDAPPIDTIEVRLLTRALEEEIGGHILGVTDVDLHDADPLDDPEFVFGGKDNRNDVAVVSTHRLGSRDPEVSVARVLKVGLHELGHNFGLVHHYRDERGSGGDLCPMTKGDFNRFGERAYVRAVIDQRGMGFCETCRRVIAAHA